MVDGRIDTRCEICGEGLALFLWSFGLISDGLDILLEGGGVVLIDEVKFIVLLEYALDLDERRTGRLLQDLVFLAVERDLLFREVLLEDEDEGVVALLLQAEGVVAVPAVDDLDHELLLAHKKI